MSHLAEIESDIKDLEALQNATKRLGLTLSGPGKVRFYTGSDRADHVLTFPGSYDLGFKLGAKGSYELVGDSELFYPRRNGRNDKVFDVLGEGLAKLFEEYNYSVLEKQANLSGYSIQRTVAQDGGLDVIMESYA